MDIASGNNTGKNTNVAEAISKTHPINTSKTRIIKIIRYLFDVNEVSAVIINPGIPSLAIDHAIIFPNATIKKIAPVLIAALNNI